MTKAKRQQAQRAGGTAQGGSFLVRLRSATGRWQGHITHVQSGRAAYFRDMEEMLGFIRDRLGERSPMSTAHHGEELHPWRRWG